MKKSTYWLGIAIVGTVLGLSIQFASAWTPPSATAPNGQVKAPVLTDGTQEITGTLTVENLIVKKNPNKSDTGNITLGDVKRNTWPGGNAIEDSGNVTFNAPGTYRICIYPKSGTEPCDKLLSDKFAQIDVEIWGGGGGGGKGILGGNNLSASFGFTVGGGGGSGAYTHTKVTVAPGDVILVTVGSGGAGGTGNSFLFGPYNNTQGTNGSQSSVTLVQRAYGQNVLKAAAGGGAGGQSVNNQNQQNYFWCDPSLSRAAGGTVTTLGSVRNTAGNAGTVCEGGYSGGWAYSWVTNLFSKTKAGGSSVVGDSGNSFGIGGYGVYVFSEVPALTCSKVTYHEECIRWDEVGGCIETRQVADPTTYVYLTAAGFPSQYTTTFNDPATTGCTYTNQSALRFIPSATNGQNGGAVISW